MAHFYQLFCHFVITHLILEYVNDENIIGRILQRSCAKTFITYGDTLAVILSPAYYLFSGRYSALVNLCTVCFCCQPPSCRGS